MKLLTITRHNDQSPSGIQYLLKIFISKIHPSITHHIAMQEFGPLTALAHQFSVPTLPLDIPRNISIIIDIKNIYLLSKYIRQNRIQIIHAHAAKPGAYARILGLFMKVNIIYTPNNWYFERQVGLRRIIYKRIESLLSRLPGFIVVVDRTEYDMIRKDINPNASLKLIHNAISEKRPPVRNIYQANRYKRIGLVIRLSHQKNPLYFIEIVEALNKYDSGYEFILIGSGPLEEVFLDMVKMKGIKNIDFRGSLSNYDTIYSEVSCIMFTSLSEGMPIVMIEAMSIGLPIITTPFRGAKKHIYSGNGIIIPYGNSDSAALEIVNKYHSFDRTILQGVMTRVQKLYSVENMLYEYYKIYGFNECEKESRISILR